jgi:hypothetical protein
VWVLVLDTLYPPGTMYTPVDFELPVSNGRRKVAVNLTPYHRFTFGIHDVHKIVTSSWWNRQRTYKEMAEFLMKGYGCTRSVETRDVEKRIGYWLWIRLRTLDDRDFSVYENCVTKIQYTNPDYVACYHLAIGAMQGVDQRDFW